MLPDTNSYQLSSPGIVLDATQTGDASDALAAHLINAASTLTVATSSSATMPPAFALTPAPILWPPPRVDP